MVDLPTAPSGPPGKKQPLVEDSQTIHNYHSGEPSKRRRDLLKKNEQPPITLSNLCPISKYYAAADKVLEQFKAHCKKHEYDDAFIIGRRFALFSTASLPNHDYYVSPKSELVQLRLQNQKDLQWVMTGLERIVKLMDREEIAKQKVEDERLRKQKEEDEKKQLEWEKSMRQRLLGASMEESSSSGFGEGDSASLDMASKLEKLNAFYLTKGDDEEDDDNKRADIIIPSAPTLDEQLSPLPPPVAPPNLNVGEEQQYSTALLNSISATQQLKSNGATPLFQTTESVPPAYSDLFLESLRTSTPSSGSSSELEELERLPSASSATSPTAIQSSKPKPAVPRTPIRILIRNYEHKMQSFQSSKQIEYIKLGTYQGRLSASNPRFDSTNGCAVISPLVVATHIYPRHIQQRHTISNYGISNSDINEIIDKRAPPILQTVRSKLGLNKHALIIPSDVHDFLVDEKILPQDKFVGVCGGDIMDTQHINKLLSMLLNGKDGDDVKNTKGKKPTTCRKAKVAAALFFREHVISIVKIPLGNGVCYYDLIDSLPSSRTGGMASRTRCKDLASFEVLLRWYASTKFTEENCNFIDANIYNEWMADFDPRTFQGKQNFLISIIVQHSLLRINTNCMYLLHMYWFYTFN